jgi:hypothetical protein
MFNHLGILIYSVKNKKSTIINPTHKVNKANSRGVIPGWDRQRREICEYGIRLAGSSYRYNYVWQIYGAQSIRAFSGLNGIGGPNKTKKRFNTNPLSPIETTCFEGSVCTDARNYEAIFRQRGY